jgi:hypothetical protein
MLPLLSLTTEYVLNFYGVVPLMGRALLVYQVH